MSDFIQWTGDNYDEVESFVGGLCSLEGDDLILEDKPAETDTNTRPLPVLVGQYITKRSPISFAILNEPPVG